MASHTEAAPARVAEPVSTSPPLSVTPPPGWLIWNLALMVLVSAFLLFQVQPLISKFILPWFGGSPAVWTTCLVFFQAVLFFGYAYAHLTTRWLSGRQQALLHGALMIVALATLPIMPAESWKPGPSLESAEPTWRILALLTATVGLPYFVLSATGPLSQAWFSRAYEHRSPYRIYALSNIGSLAALVTYPFLFEPAFTAETQAKLWSGGFLLFALLGASIAAWIGLRRAGRVHLPEEALAATGQPHDRPSAARRLVWLCLPALSTLMLLATTNHVCQNFAPIPLLWVVPLSLYLLSFIICFDHERWYRRGPYCAALAVLTFLAAGGASPICDWLNDWAPEIWPAVGPDAFHLGFVGRLVLYFATMFCICMVCHGELVRSRPKPRYLTEFYLMISGGGALGGLLVSLVAPHVFVTFLEWNLGLVAAYLLAMSLIFIELGSGLSARFANFAANKLRAALPLAARLAVAALLIFGIRCVAYWQWDDATPADDSIYRARNFYGLVQVKHVNSKGREYMLFRSGNTVHGEQWVSDDPAARMRATTYYSPDSGVGSAVAYVLNRPDARIGVVGLGAGTIAAYPKQKSQVLRFYEINPEVVGIAKNYFTFLKECKGTVEVVLGDARLSMERELKDGPQNYDVLVLDAFSGDAPPVHLLTREAFAVYQRHLKPNGIIAINIKNHYIHFAPVMLAAAQQGGYSWTRRWTDEDPARLVYAVDWMLLTKDQQFLKQTPMTLDQGEDPNVAPAVWTDHFSNLFQLLMKQ